MYIYIYIYIERERERARDPRMLLNVAFITALIYCLRLSSLCRIIIIIIIIIDVYYCYC